MLVSSEIFNVILSLNFNKCCFYYLSYLLGVYYRQPQVWAKGKTLSRDESDSVNYERNTEYDSDKSSSVDYASVNYRHLPIYTPYKNYYPYEHYYWKPRPCPNRRYPSTRFDAAMYSADQQEKESYENNVKYGRDNSKSYDTTRFDYGKHW